MKIIISGGGTAGHVSPSLSVVQSLEEKIKDTDILYIGTEKGIEATIIPKVGINYKSISAGKLRRYHKSTILNVIDPLTIFKNIKDILRVFKGIFQAMKEIKEFKPDAIFLKGGYVSIPVGLAARFLNIPFVLHESDIVPGLANRVLSKHAKTVCVSFPKEVMKKEFPENTKILYTGNPIRKEILEGSKEEAIKKFNLNKKNPVILIIGGSQGALKVNALIESCLEDLLYKYQVIHITGEYSYDWIDFRAKKLNKELREKYHYFDFISADLKDAFKIADLIISRAGCNVLTEIAALKKPSILIPLSSSAQNHQYRNALQFSRDGGAYILDENKNTAHDLLKQIEYIFENKDELKIMSEKASYFYKPDASSIIAEEVLRVAREKREKEENEKSKEKKE